MDDAIDRYLITAGPDVARRFVDALERSYAHLSRHPGTGSPRYAHALDLPGLRTWPVTRFPYLIFYFDLTTEVRVGRVLHQALDLTSLLEGDV